MNAIRRQRTKQLQLKPHLAGGPVFGSPSIGCDGFLTGAAAAERPRSRTADSARCGGVTLPADIHLGWGTGFLEQVVGDLQLLLEGLPAVASFLMQVCLRHAEWEDLNLEALLVAF